MDRHLEQLHAARQAWRAREWPAPELLVVSGSGLAVELPGTTEREAPLAEVLPFPIRPVVGHPHTVTILEPLPGRFVAYQRGRLHSYQGYDANETAFMVRLAALLGGRKLILTNAAGGIRPDLGPGDLVAVTDHINLTGLNPLRGELPADWGPAFPDMTGAYDPDLRRLLAGHARRLDIALAEGVYCGLAGPNFETPAEIRMLRSFGADLVGMSTVLEVVAARHLDVACLAVSMVANAAAGVGDGAIDHEEVLAEAGQRAEILRRLLGALLIDEDLYSP